MGNGKGKLGNGSKSKRGDFDSSMSKEYSNNDLDRQSSGDFDDDSMMPEGPITDYYIVDENVVLGRGHYAVVNLATNRQTGEKVAVKRIAIAKSKLETLTREIDVLRKVGRHPNIVTLYKIFITDTELILVLELLLGGELFDRLVDHGPYSEREASHHIRKVVEALKYLHKRGIVHRDLKPENLILTEAGKDSELKIADFGLAKIVDGHAKNAVLKTVCGTWAYCAPEVKTSCDNSGAASYSAKCDMWSVGIILYVILGAYHPFDPDGDATDALLWTNICRGEFDFKDPAWDHISRGAKDLIRHLIVLDPAKRYGPDEVLKHPWIRQRQSVPSTPITPNIDQSLGDFSERRRSKKYAMVDGKLVEVPTNPSKSGNAMTQRPVAMHDDDDDDMGATPPLPPLVLDTLLPGATPMTDRMDIS